MAKFKPGDRVFYTDSEGRHEGTVVLHPHPTFWHTEKMVWSYWDRPEDEDRGWNPSFMYDDTIELVDPTIDGDDSEWQSVTGEEYMTLKKFGVNFEERAIKIIEIRLKKED